MSRLNYNAKLELSTAKYTTYIEAIADAGLMPVPLYLPRRHGEKEAKGWSTAAWSNQHWANNIHTGATGAGKAQSWLEAVAPAPRLWKESV